VEDKAGKTKTKNNSCSSMLCNGCSCVADVYVDCFYVAGVTLWELFSYGQRPYEDVRAVDIPSYLERGTRLAQPAVCTIDVYMILIKCN